MQNEFEMKKLLLLTIGIFFLINLSAQCSSKSSEGIHVIQPGENLYRISKAYGLSIQELCALNEMEANAVLSVCQELIVGIIPSETETATVPSEYEEPTKAKEEEAPLTPQFIEEDISNYQKQAGKKHTVRLGETIAGLAKLYGYTEQRFRDLNALPFGEATANSILLSTDCTCDRIGEIQIGTTSTGIRTAPGGQTSNGTSSATAKKNPYNNDYSASTSDAGGGPPAKTNASYMKSEEALMIDEINLVRSNPAAYIKHVDAYAAKIKSGEAFPMSDALIKELKDQLRNTEPLSILQPKPCIYEAAKKHGQDLIKMGDANHKGSDGSWPWDRVKSSCSNMSDGGENLVGGPSEIRDAVLLLLFDEGISTRGHRNTLLNPDWKYVACYHIGQLGDMPNNWIQNYGK